MCSLRGISPQLSFLGSFTGYLQSRSHCSAVLPNSKDNLSIGRPTNWNSEKGILPHSTPATLYWLKNNYQVADGVCIPRCVIYGHYNDFCALHRLTPVNPASFGKILKQVFPTVSTRRLGNRGKSKYHYFGLGIQEISPYFELKYSARGVLQNRLENNKSELNGRLHSSKSQVSNTALTLEFPRLEDLGLSVSDNSSLGHLSGFLTMYRTHCQRIYDFISFNNMDEMENIILYFWKGLPTHILNVMESKITCSMICVCDSILYRSICNLFFDSVIKCINSSLLPIAQHLVSNYESWLKTALEYLPDNLRTVKINIGRQFIRLVERQMTLHELCRGARMAIHDLDSRSQMIRDWEAIDINLIKNESLTLVDVFESPNDNSLLVQSIAQQFKNFGKLLEPEVGIESFTAWLDTVVDSCVLRLSRGLGAHTALPETIRHFIVVWTSFDSRIIRDMTLSKAKTFGSFHMLSVLCSDYLQLRLEMVLMDDKANMFLRSSLHDLQDGNNKSWQATVTENISPVKQWTGNPADEVKMVTANAPKAPVASNMSHILPNMYHQDSEEILDPAFGFQGTSQFNNEILEMNTFEIQTYLAPSGIQTEPNTNIPSCGFEGTRSCKRSNEVNVSKYLSEYSFIGDSTFGVDADVTTDSTEYVDYMLIQDWNPSVLCNSYPLVDVQFDQR